MAAIYNTMSFLRKPALYAIDSDDKGTNNSTGASVSMSSTAPSVLFVFKGDRSFDSFSSTFSEGNLFIRMSNGRHDVIALVKPTSIVVNFGGNPKPVAHQTITTSFNIDGVSKLIDRCQNVAISFKLDGMAMSSEHVQALEEYVYTQCFTYDSVEIVRRNSTYVKRYSTNLMFVLASDAAIKQVPLLVSIQYELA